MFISNRLCLYVFSAASDVSGNRVALFDPTL